MKSRKMKIPGATLYYEVWGAGPVLLMIAGGSTDAGFFEGIASFLAYDYMVITYDPRGNSRSPLDGPPEDQQIAVHSDDACRLLEAVGAGPAAVFGTASGALVALDLIARHPTSITRVVAHEPPLLAVLPDAARWYAFNDQVYETYRREGATSAMRQWITGVGLDGVIPPPDAQLPPEMVAAMRRMAGNWDLFLGYELRTFTRYRPDMALLSAQKERIVLAAGRDTRDQLAYRPTAWLAEQFGTQVVEFPGGHAGYSTQSARFAATLRQVLK